MGNEKGNYKKGYRKDIVFLMHGFGLMTRPMISMLPYGDKMRMVNRMLRDMTAEGIIAMHRTQTSDATYFYCFNDYNKDKNEITVAVPQEIIQFYEENYKNDLFRLWTQKDSRVLRRIRDAEILGIMYSAGVACLPEDHNTNGHYYTSRDIKNYSDYGDDVKESNGNRKVDFTKLFGMLTTEYNDYAIYRANKKDFMHISKGEYKIKAQLDLILTDLKEKRMEINNAIYYLNDMDFLAPIIRNDEFTKQNAKLFTNIAKIYNNIFVVPYNKQGRDMTRIMTTRDWKQRMLYTLLEITEDTYQNLDTSYTGIQCDYYDYSKREAYLLFCSPNIVKLHGFYVYAREKNNRKKARVYCFDFQKQFVEKVIGEYATIYTVDFQAYYNEFAFNEDEG